MITLIDRNRALLRDGMITESSLTSIELALSGGTNVLIYLNRRGAYRSYICGACSHIETCPHCDVSLTLHTSPSNKLLCHHCGYHSSVPTVCSKCGSTELK